MISKIRAFMKHLYPALLIAALALAGACVHAERADRDKPLTIDADALRHDDQKQITLFTGRVTANKGTIAMRGARLEVRQDVQGNQFGILTADPGQRAYFRQKREGMDEFIEGEAEQIEYDSAADTVLQRHHRDPMAAARSSRTASCRWAGSVRRGTGRARKLRRAVVGLLWAQVVKGAGQDHGVST
jgi:lipopolysaccharide transport protein LptA